MGRPEGFDRVRKLPLVGKAADWGMGPSAVSKKTKKAGARIAGLKATESVCPYCAVGCGQVVYAREDGWLDTDDEGRRVDRTMGFAHLGGATLDNEENYLIKKAFTAMGAIQIENQARI